MEVVSNVNPATVNVLAEEGHAVSRFEAVAAGKSFVEQDFVLPERTGVSDVGKGPSELPRAAVARRGVITDHVNPGFYPVDLQEGIDGVDAGRPSDAAQPFQGVNAFPRHGGGCNEVIHSLLHGPDIRARVVDVRRDLRTGSLEDG